MKSIKGTWNQNTNALILWFLTHTLNSLFCQNSPSCLNVAPLHGKGFWSSSASALQFAFTLDLRFEFSS